MQSMEMAKQMVELNKAAFNNSFNTMVVMQEQAEKMAGAFFEQVAWIPEDGKKVINEWVEVYKNGLNEFKKAMDANFQKVESYFAQGD